MADPLLSDITFRREGLQGTLQLRLAGSLDRKPGTTPGVVRAFAPHWQVQGLRGNLSAQGTITLYDGNLAGNKIELAGYLIVDAYPSDFDSDGQPVEWELFFADARRVFVKPLGGEMSLGEINRGPVNRTQRTDARGLAIIEATDLIALCVNAMGVEPHGGVPSVPEARAKFITTDLKWDGAWAPGELEELCKTYGVVFFPRMDGGYGLGVLDDGPWPNPPGPFVVTPLPPAGRVTDVVVLRSTPQPMLETMNLIPQPETGFEWVLPEKDSRGRISYLPVDQVEWLSAVPGFPQPGTALKALTESIALVPVEWHQTLKTDLYRLIRVPVSLLGPGVAPLNQEYGVEGPIGGAVLIADGAAMDVSTATWSMPGEIFVPVGRIVSDVSGAIVVLTAQAFKLREGVTSVEDVSVWSEAEALSSGDCYLRMTREVADEKGRLQYFEIGFRRSGDGDITRLSDAEISSVAKSGVISVPSLVKISVQPEGTSPEGDSIDNEEELFEEAAAIAESLLGRRGEAAEFVMPGYWPVELSGAVSSVSYTQTPPETRYTVGSHYRPAQGKAGTGGAAGVGHTPSRSTDAAKAAAGSVSSSPYSRVLAESPGSVQAAGEGGTFVHVDGREKGRGKYLASVITLPETTTPDSTVVLGGFGEKVLLVNFGDLFGRVSHRLQAESVVGPVRFAGSLDLPPPEGSPEGTPRDRRKICYVAYEPNVYRSFRTKIVGDELWFQGSKAAQALDQPAGQNTPAIDDWETLLTFKNCPPPGGT